MDDYKDLRLEIPSYAYISLARRGMEKISLDQCFLPNCDNEDVNLLEPLKIEESEDNEKHTKKIHIKCKKCDGVYILKLETLKKVAKPKNSDDEDSVLSLGIVSILDEKGNNLGHLGYF
jgi:hypothetical protein